MGCTYSKNKSILCIHTHVYGSMSFYLKCILCLINYDKQNVYILFVIVYSQEVEVWLHLNIRNLPDIVNLYLLM